jgi:hypothetical protein
VTHLVSCFGDMDAVLQLFTDVMNKLFEPVPSLQHNNHWFLPSSAAETVFAEGPAPAARVDLAGEDDDDASSAAHSQLATPSSGMAPIVRADPLDDGDIAEAMEREVC